MIFAQTLYSQVPNVLRSHRLIDHSEKISRTEMVLHASRWGVSECKACASIVSPKYESKQEKASSINLLASIRGRWSL